MYMTVARFTGVVPLLYVLREYFRNSKEERRAIAIVPRCLSGWHAHIIRAHARTQMHSS